MSTEPNPRAVAGNNNPPTLTEELEDRYSDLEEKILRLVHKARSVQQLKIETDADVEAVGAIVKEARALAGQAEDARTKEKEPHLAAGRTVDEYFHKFAREHRTSPGRLTRIINVLSKRLSDHQADKLAHARARRLEEERLQKLREETARKKAEEALAKGNKEEAEEASATADAFAALREQREGTAPKAADEVRVRGADATVSTRMVWTHEIDDIRKIDLNSLRPYLPEEVVKKAIAAAVADGKRDLDGIRIFQEPRAIVR